MSFDADSPLLVNPDTHCPALLPDNLSSRLRGGGLKSTRFCVIYNIGNVLGASYLTGLRKQIGPVLYSYLIDLVRPPM